MYQYRQNSLKLNHARHQFNNCPVTPPQSPLLLSMSYTVSPSARSNDILANLDFSATDIERFMNLPPFVTTDKSGTETQIPASYVREKGTTRFLRTWMNRHEATHYLVITSPSGSTWPPTPPHAGDNREEEEEEEMGWMGPVHEWVLASQSITWSRRIEEAGIDGTPVVRLSVPHVPSIHALLFFLHHHDEEVLFRSLEKQWSGGSPEGEVWIRGFLANVVRLGVLDARIRGVVWAVLEPES